MNLVELNNVSIGYANSTIGKNINFTLPKDSIVCLLGSNGCGKTTLLKTLLGLLPALSGSITVNGKPLSDWRPLELARFSAYVPQAHHGMFPFLVEDVVLMGRTVHMQWFAVPGKKDRTIAEQALATLGILHLKLRRYTELSGGERQLVLIARALAQQPSLLVMDEPAASLDFGNQIRILEQITQLKKQGIAVLMSTHHPQHAYSIADNVALMLKGRLIEQGSSQQVLQPDKLAEIYDVSVEKIKQNLPALSASL